MAFESYGCFMGAGGFGSTYGNIFMLLYTLLLIGIIVALCLWIKILWNENKRRDHGNKQRHH